MLALHEYFRSGSSFRTRIALNLKGLDYEHHSVHLRRNGGEQHAEDYKRMNPQELVPTLVDGKNSLIQSLSIIEYLDETHPEPPLLPADPADRSWVRSMAMIVACEMHPINNLRVLQYLRQTLGHDEDTVRQWIHTWFETGFSALEKLLSEDDRTGMFCHGDTPGLADICLVPQVFSGQRFEFDMRSYPTVLRINDNCLERPEFQAALPAKQPDAQ